MKDIDKLINFYLFGCTGIIPAIILGFICIFNLGLGLILFIPVMLVWYLLVALAWFNEEQWKKEQKKVMKKI